MKRQPLDIYEEMPPMMKKYLNAYGWHFSKKACEYACSLMKRKNPTTGKKESIEPWKKEEVEQIMSKYSITLEHGVMYDSTYIMNMARSDYYKSSITDEQHLALFVKDYLDDEDGTDELAFRRWLASMVGIGIPIEWEDMM